PGEHRRLLEDTAFDLVQEVIRPLHGVAQCLVPFHRSPRPGEQPKPLVEPVADLTRAHGANAGRRELDRERDAVEAATDLGDNLEVVAWVEGRYNVPRPLDEERRCRRVRAQPE